MRVAIDATPLTLSSGGLVRYTSELSLALAREFASDRVTLVSDQRFPMPEAAPPNLTRGRLPSTALDRRWWLLGLSRELAHLRVDVFHGANFEVPYLPLRASVLSLLDLSPWMDPRWHHAADRVRRRAPMLMGLGLATMILTISEAVRREAISTFRLPSSRVVATPLAAAGWFRPALAKPWPRPYFLFTGTLEPRKNLTMLIDAWRQLRHTQDVDLLLVGRRRADFIHTAGDPEPVFLGEAPDTDLPALYSGAVAVVYPSLYEGFGLPVLEAMSCGAAVFASRGAALMEVSGGAALHLDATDSAAWEKAMSAALWNKDWIGAMRERSLRRASVFSWAQTARLTREVYEEARRRFAC